MICEKEKCTGCFACYNCCPQSCITMQEDDFGAIYPKIDETRCIHCHLCEKICPVNQPVEQQYPLKCLAMKSKEKGILENSTSGGAATIFSKAILEKNGIVYGAAFFTNRTVKHVRIEKIQDLKQLQGSKYVHSYIQDSFKQIQKDLRDNKYVLFIGTPCQVAGLRNYLNRDYEKLYKVDIICHGVPTQKFLKEEINQLVKKEKVENLSFRDKEGYVLKLYQKNKLLKKKDMLTSKYYLSFINGVSFRENCYICPYANPNRVSDITIGDFWGLGKDSKFFMTKEEGVSVILPITTKGIQLIEQCHIEMDLEERNITEAIDGNTQLYESSKKTKQVERFRKEYILKGYKGVYNIPLTKMKIKNKIKEISFLNNVYKKIKGE